MLLLAVFILLHINFTPTDGFKPVDWTAPAKITANQGQDVSITWIANISAYPQDTTWQFVKLEQNSNDLLSYKATKELTILKSSYQSRAADIGLNVTQNNAIVTITLKLANLNKLTDEATYNVLPLTLSNFDSLGSDKAVKLVINVPPAITFYSSNMTVNESQSILLVCNATGSPQPSINWTKNGEVVGTGTPFNTVALTWGDDKTCYKCIAYNVVPPSTTVSTCMNVQYTPKNISLSVDRQTVCLNDNVTLTCTFGTANPSVTGYDFYNNNVGVGSSQSNVFFTKATSPNLNTFECAAKNLLGASMKASANVTAKVAPVIVTPPTSTTVKEGNAVNLFCNASGQPAPTITWTKVGWGIVGSGDTYSINVTLRGHDGTYRCSASNGVECKSATADAIVTVNYGLEPVEWSAPAKITASQGQSVSITWTLNISAYPQDTTWQFVKFQQNSNEMLTYKPNKQLTIILPSYQSRSADLGFNVTQNKSIVTITFTLANLNKLTDEATYNVKSMTLSNFDSHNSDKTVELVINVPPAITFHSSNMTVNESQSILLVCNAIGSPQPSINWTKNGEVVGTGTPFNTLALTWSDDKTCYKCIAYNVVPPSTTASTCLNVQYKPRTTVLAGDKTTVCKNDKVTLTCTSGPANPAPSSYEFYNNGVLVGTSASNVYIARATAVLPSVNKFVCVSRNLLGDSLKNGSVEVTAKEKPLIVTPPISTNLTEGRSLTLFCNASGRPAPNITWTKVGGCEVGNNETFIIPSVTKGDEGTYRCTASNGAECNTASAVAAVTIYKPGTAVIVGDKTTVCQNDNVTLTCTPGPANPAPSSYQFYNNGVLVGTSACNVYVARATAVLPSVNKFVCVPRNLLGDSLKNGSVEVTAKEKPLIVTPPISTNLTEGRSLTLFCNASGRPAPNITWTKVGGCEVGNNETFIIPSVTKGDEGLYRCTASNGAECNTASAVATVTIYSMSEVKPYFKVTKDSLTVTWKKLSEYVNAECRISVMKLSNGSTWLTASNTSQKTLLSCTVNELLSDTTYIAKFVLKLSQRNVNGTIYIATAPPQECNCRLDKQKEDCNGTPYVVLGVIIALSLLVFIILISYIIWIHKKGSYGKERRSQSAAQELTTDIRLQETRKSLSNRSPVTDPIPEYEDVENVQTITSIPVYDPVYRRKELSRSAYVNEEAFEIQFDSPRHENSPDVATDLSKNLKEMRPKDHRDQENNPVNYGNLIKCPRESNEIQARSEENPVEKNNYQALQFSDQNQPYMSLKHVKSSYKL